MRNRTAVCSSLVMQPAARAQRVSLLVAVEQPPESLLLVPEPPQAVFDAKRFRRGRRLA